MHQSCHKKITHITHDLFFYITKLYIVFASAGCFLADIIYTHVLKQGTVKFSNLNLLQYAVLLTFIIFIFASKRHLINKPLSKLADEYNLIIKKPFQGLNNYFHSRALFKKILKKTNILAILLIITTNIFTWKINKYINIPGTIYNQAEFKKEIISSPYYRSHHCKPTGYNS
jgi:hypothetical protein